MKPLARILLLSSSLALSSTAWSIPLSTVGGVDTLLAQTTLRNSGEQTEIAWIESVLGISLASFDYTQTSVTASDFMRVEDLAGTFAFELAAPTDWFLVKIGNNSGSPSTHFLFDNIFDLNYATVNLVAMGFASKNTFNIGKISHIGTGAAVRVPETGSLTLLGLGLGLLGLAVARRVTQ